jgi:hypothetical protein
MAKPLERDQIEFTKWNPDTHKRISVVRTGDTYRLQGAEIVLFPVGVLLEILDRDAQALRRWERTKQFPVPQWKVPDKRCKHWYSLTQLSFIRDTYMLMSRNGDHGFSHSPYFPLQAFLKAIREQFYKLDARKVEGDAA